MKNKAAYSDKIMTLLQLNEIRKSGTAFSNYVFSLYSYVDALYKQSLIDGVTDIYFLSREGAFLKKLYDMYVSNKGEEAPVSHYMYISRKAAIMSALVGSEEETFDFVERYPHINARDFLKCIGLGDDDIAKCCFSDSIDLEKYETDFHKKQTFERIKENESFQQIYEQKRTANQAAFNEYLTKIGFFDSDHVAIADVGWSGTIQNQLCKIIPNKKIIGFYIGYASLIQDTPFNVKRGLLFDYRCRKDCYNYACFMFELVLSARDGAVIGYGNDGIPIFEEDSACKLYSEFFEPVQEGICRSFEKLCLISSCNNKKTIEEFCRIAHTLMLFFRTKQETEIIDKCLEYCLDNLVDVKNNDTRHMYFLNFKARIWLSYWLVRCSMSIAKRDNKNDHRK